MKTRLKAGVSRFGIIPGASTALARRNPMARRAWGKTTLNSVVEYWEGSKDFTRTSEDLLQNKVTVSGVRGKL